MFLVQCLSHCDNDSPLLDTTCSSFHLFILLFLWNNYVPLYFFAHISFHLASKVLARHPPSSVMMLPTETHASPQNWYTRLGILSLFLSAFMISPANVHLTYVCVRPFILTLPIELRCFPYFGRKAISWWKWWIILLPRGDSLAKSSSSRTLGNRDGCVDWSAEWSYFLREKW